MPISETKLNEFLGRAIQDMGAAAAGALVVMGDRLGLYRAMAGVGPLTAGEVAQRAGTGERHTREWLNAQAAGGYVEYDPATVRYTLPDEQAFALADENSPSFLPGFYQAVWAMWHDEPKVREAFRTGQGVAWGDHHHDLFCGTERFFRPGYAASLIASWIPSLDGMVDRLKAGARVADVGCGHGASTLIMAEAFPASEFIGFDSHTGSIDAAHQRAREKGMEGRVRFEVASAKQYPGEGYDLVCFFDCLHDMGDPAGAARHVRGTLKDDGTLMIVEPFANDRVEENLNPVGRIYYAASTMVCTPASLAQEVGTALGAQAGEARLREIVCSGGFTRFRRATQTPFNIVLEARP